MQLSDVKGLKEKRIAELNKAGILTPMDLLSYFPTQYVDLENLTDFSGELKTGEWVVFCASFTEKPKTAFIRRNLTITTVRFEVPQAKLSCVWFNRKYFASSISLNVPYYFIGKVKLNGKAIEIINPKLLQVDKCKERFAVFYKPLKGLPSNVIATAQKAVLSKIDIVSFIPQNLREEHGLMPLNDAYRIIHCPQSLKEIAAAKYSITIEYLNYTLCAYDIIRRRSVTEKRRAYVTNEKAFSSAINALPFSLTADQIMAVKSILRDMNAKTCMNRLVQGDVGSGKTIVAFLAMYYAYLSGYQSVLMCPTELLANQHYASMKRFFPEVEDDVCLLHAGLLKKEREQAAIDIASGKAKIIVGTHSVFSENVVFNDLALVVTDEQHRFGVNQRSSLENKANMADCLVMSATPIPRTLALTLYGELSQSIISTMPKNKAQTSTKIVPERKVSDMWRYLFDCAEKDERTYVVCPRIEEDEEDAALVSCVKLYAEKKKNNLFVAMLHGRMSDKEKRLVMEKFASGEVKILISTTVIEVGIDVPEATNIVIYNPERYGLSQLHQLRGRVGRGQKKSYCFLVMSESTLIAEDRLTYLEKCSDGFALAEYDFNSRGAGDFLGNAQHGRGEMPIRAEDIMKAKEISSALMQNKSVIEEISKTLTDNRFEYYKNITLN